MNKRAAEGEAEARINITLTMDLASESVYVSEKTIVSGESFLKLNGDPAEKDIRFDWLIIK